MAKFPQSVKLPNTVAMERLVRQKYLLRAMLGGMGIRTLIIIAELIGVAFFGSASLLTDALSSLVDVIGSLVLLLFIKLAERPPDEDHPFGHGRYEPLAGLQLGLLLALSGGVMFVYQTFEISKKEVGTLDPRTWAIPFAAFLLLEFCYFFLKHIAKKHHSAALQADAVHYRVDSLTSLLATIALLIAAYVPEWSLFVDHLGAISIALLMVGLGVMAAHSNLHQVMDKPPEEKYFEKVRQAARRVEGVKDTEKIRIQLYGPDAHVDIDIEVSPKLSVEEAHRISQYVRAEIQKEWPSVREVVVHIEPFYSGDH